MMTDKHSSTVVVSRELLPCPFCGETLRVNNSNLGVHPRDSDCLFKQQVVVVDSPAQVSAWNRRAAPVEQLRVHVPDECPLMIVFDDADREPISFAGAGSKQAALKTWAQISNSWNAHLFVRIARNSRDDRYPSATVSAVEQQGEPVAYMVKYHLTESIESAQAFASNYGVPESQIHPLYFSATQSAQPRITMADTMRAYQSASRSPHLVGTSNWCAHMAEQLNLCSEVDPQCSEHLRT